LFQTVVVCLGKTTLKLTETPSWKKYFGPSEARHPATPTLRITLLLLWLLLLCHREAICPPFHA